VNDLEKEEVDIVTGALAYKEKTVRSVMTPLENAYLLNIKTVLDFDTISEIREQASTPCTMYCTLLYY
jgi:metal transporter CNNM